MIAGKYLFAQVAEGIHSISKILLCKPCWHYQPLFAKSSAAIVCSFPTFDCIVWL